MKSEYKYVVEVSNENNEDWSRIYEGSDAQEAEKTFDEYKFVDGDNALQLSRFEMTWSYEGQKEPDINPVPKTLNERYM